MKLSGRKINQDLDEVWQGCVEGAKKRRAKGSEKPESIKRRGRSSNIGAKATIQQVAMKSNENEVEERKVKVSILPVHVLEKIISYLDWRNLGKAMLVCHRWKETGGHPSLWTNSTFWSRVGKLCKDPAISLG